MLSKSHQSGNLNLIESAEYHGDSIYLMTSVEKQIYILYEYTGTSKERNKLIQSNHIEDKIRRPRKPLLLYSRFLEV